MEELGRHPQRRAPAAGFPGRIPAPCGQALGWALDIESLYSLQSWGWMGGKR